MPDASSQGAVFEGRGYIYLAHPVFSSYALHAHEVELELVRACVGRLLTQPLVKTTLPGTAEVTVTKQKQRTIVHVLNYVPEHLHKNGDIVTAAQYILGTVAIAMPRKPTRIYSAPSGGELAWNWESGYACCSLPPTLGYAVIVLE